MFSDMLTPLTAMGIEFDVLKGKGPVIFDPIRTEKQVQEVQIVKVYNTPTYEYICRKQRYAIV
jgi:uroporphyrinogen-III decarboxylase